MSEHKKASGGLFGLLARQYLLFTLTLLLIGAALFSLWDWYTARQYQATDWGALLADEALAHGAVLGFLCCAVPWPPAAILPCTTGRGRCSGPAARALTRP